MHYDDLFAVELRTVFPESTSSGMEMLQPDSMAVASSQVRGHNGVAFRGHGVENSVKIQAGHPGECFTHSLKIISEGRLTGPSKKVLWP